LRPSNPDASPASGPSPRSGSIAHEQHPVVTCHRSHRSACPTTISRRQQPHSADGALSLDLGRQNPDPSARWHGAHATLANQNHRPRYPFKPAVPSESGQVAQNLALNPHRPTLPPAQTSPAVSSFEAFRTPASVQPLAPLTGRHPKTLNVSGQLSRLPKDPQPLALQGRVSMVQRIPAHSEPDAHTESEAEVACALPCPLSKAGRLTEIAFVDDAGGAGGRPPPALRQQHCGS
jgi:hypothetical protein